MAAAKVQPHMSLGLRVLSSSLQVEQPINFDDLPATTTVGQLKEKIQQVLPHHQPREHQRLIYRGRLLADDNETLVNVVGEETVSLPASLLLVISRRCLHFLHRC